jgi:hypothetical protein
VTTDNSGDYYSALDNLKFQNWCSKLQAFPNIGLVGSQYNRTIILYKPFKSISAGFQIKADNNFCKPTTKMVKLLTGYYRLLPSISEHFTHLHRAPYFSLSITMEKHIISNMNTLLICRIKNHETMSTQKPYLYEDQSE